MREKKTISQIKSEQLGMSHSTASHKLRKMIMFKLVQQCGLDNCYRCGEKIDIDNFSIEHIESWLHSENPKELFFDLDNISFSHTSCNYAHARQPKTKPRNAPNGKSKLKGVSYYEGKTKPYRACVTIDRKSIWLGSFSTEEEAGLAYDTKIIELYGENAVTNKSLGLL